MESGSTVASLKSKVENHRALAPGCKEGDVSSIRTFGTDERVAGRLTLTSQIAFLLCDAPSAFSTFAPPGTILAYFAISGGRDALFERSAAVLFTLGQVYPNAPPINRAKPVTNKSLGGIIDVYLYGRDSCGTRRRTARELEVRDAAAGISFCCCTEPERLIRGKRPEY